MKIFTFFALVFGKKLYIGKTSSGRLSAVYRRHCRGEVIATKRFTKKGGKPRLHLLHREEMDPYQAYRFVVAFVYMFQEAGYEILNCAKTIMRASDLHPETETLANELKKENVDELLVRTLVGRPTAADFKLPTEEKVVREAATEKITVRATPREKERFAKFAAEMNLNQRQTLQYLISKCQMKDEIFPPWEDDPYVRAIIGSYREENQKLKDANEGLREQLGDGRKNALERKNQQLQLLKTGVKAFFEMMRPDGKLPLTIPQGMYKDCSYTDKYHYPTAVGVYILRPTDILYGKGRYPAIFILGVGDDEEYLQFRFYPKSYFTGVSPKNEQFWLRSSVWLIGCEQANDGAMDMVFAFPLDVKFRYNGPDEYGSKMKRDIANLMQETQEYN